MVDLPDEFVADLRNLRPWPELEDSLWRSPALVELTYGRLWALVAEALPAAPARILDVGSGLGALSLEMARLGHDVTGIDPADPAREVATRSAENAAPGQLTYLDGGVESWAGQPAASHSEPAPVVAPRGARTGAGSSDGFDVVVTTRVLHHVDDCEVVVERLRSWLRPRGRLVCVDFGYDRFDRRAAAWLAQTRGLLEAVGRSRRDGRLPADPDAAVEQVQWEWDKHHVVEHQLNPLAAIEEPLRQHFPTGTWSWHPYLYWEVLEGLDASGPEVDAGVGRLVMAWEATLLAADQLPGLLFRLVA